MRLLKLYFIFLLILSSILSGQWKRTYNPHSGSVNAMVHSGDLLFAGTDNGIYISSDEGKNWVQYENNLTDLKITCLDMNKDFIYATTEYNLFASSDKGRNWVSVASITRAKFVKIAGQKLFVGDLNGIYSKEINESKWNYNSYGDFPDSYDSFAVCDSVYYVAGNYYLLCSYDKCKTWTRIIAPASIYQISSCGPFIYAATSSGLYTKMNGVHEWTKKFPVFTSSIITDDEKIYILAFGSTNGWWPDGLYSSSDYGETWIEEAKQRTNNAFLLCHFQKTTYINTRIGCFASIPETKKWKPSGPSNCTVTDFAESGDNMFASLKAGGVFVSSDNGITWQNTPDMHDYNVNSLLVFDTTLFAATFSGLEYLKGMNNNWISDHYNFYGDEIRSIISIDTTFFVSAVYGLYKTGKTVFNWVSVKGFENINVGKLYSINNYCFAATYSGVYFSENRGESWHFLGLAGKYVTALFFNNGKFYCGTNDNAVYMTSDFGSTWKILTNGEIASVPKAIIEYNDNVFVGTANHGVFVYRYGTGSWQQTGLKNIEVNVLKIKNDSLYAGTAGKGIYITSLKKLIDSTDSVTIINSYSYKLEQNYPNPFNSNTVINFYLASVSNVKLHIYNINGQLVKTLINDVQMAEGQHTYFINSKDLSSGVYFYRLIAGDKAISKKMVVLK